MLRDDTSARPAAMTYRVVVGREDELISQAARLHHEALSHRSFVTSFGVGFLEQLYVGLLELELGFLVVAERAGRLAGFILACQDSDRLMSVVLRRPHRFVGAMLRVMISRPSVLRKLVQTLSYAEKEGSTIRAELVVIAVRPELRSQGAGRGLLTALEKELIRRGTSAYKVTVHDEMDGSNRFYQANGMTLAHKFRLYDVTWNLYEKRIDRP